ncbi:MAG TPA: XkdF-like putative serine protease domain-containing protein [Atribacterota bacterium]|nr:XkdF-like putative serine protease domain-containing protein [Atribacterota bacterium]
MKKDYIGYVEGYICTTNIDSHGDKLSPENIENIKKQIDQKPMLRIMKLKHNIKDSCGEMVEYRVDTKGKWKGLWAKVGIYKNRRDVWEMHKSGELTGFSISVKLVEDDSDFMEKDKFFIKINPEYRHEIKEILDKENIKNEVYLKKAADEGAIFSIIIPVGLFIINILYDYWKTKRENNKNININITIQNKNYNFINSSPDEIKKHLRSLQEIKKK